jgi:hypothetical protein
MRCRLLRMRQVELGSSRTVEPLSGMWILHYQLARVLEAPPIQPLVRVLRDLWLLLGSEPLSSVRDSSSFRVETGTVES